MRGDQGPYVTKIQTALIEIDRANIPASELESGFYGPGTAAAVLAFKRARRIINPKYQSQADDIVGKMTIDRLDKEMKRREKAQPAPPTPVPPTPVPVVDDFEPPVSGYPEDLKETLRTSNSLRTPQNNYLAPIIPWGDDKKTLRELSRLIAASPDFPIVREIYDRMKRFGIWSQVRAIRNVYRGIGSHGFACDPVDHNAFMNAMTVLTRPRSALEAAALQAPFCRDIANVHGPRDSFRESVTWGPGLHICITQPSHRATEACDIHIDQYQQGSDCVGGYCIPRVLDARTVAHLISVAPWLASEAKQKIRDYLKSKDIPVPW
jgi:hypothetical protein